MKDLLAIFGLICFGTILATIIAFLWNEFKEWIIRLKYDYKVKHRFDKPPTAKCYCIDCTHHDDHTKQCYRFGQTTKEYRCTADCWFCWEANPRKKENKNA